MPRLAEGSAIVTPRALIEYDGTRISVQKLDPAKGPQPPRLEPPEKNRGFEIEIGYYVPAFLDYPAEWAGTTEVGGRSCYQLRVTGPLGSQLTYAIDASTHLITRVRAEVLADGKLTFWGDRFWSDYRIVQGIQYPHTIVSANRDGSSTRTVVTRVNIHPRWRRGRDGGVEIAGSRPQGQRRGVRSKSLTSSTRCGDDRGVRSESLTSSTRCGDSERIGGLSRRPFPVLVFRQGSGLKT